MFFKAGYFVNPIPETETYTYRLSGTVASGNSALKTIWIYRREDGRLLGQCPVEVDGTWMTYVQTEVPGGLLVICRDEGEDFNADIYDRVSQCTDTILEEPEYTVERFAVDPKIYKLPNTLHADNNILPVEHNAAAPASFNLTMDNGIIRCPEYLEGVYHFYDSDDRQFYGYCHNGICYGRNIYRAGLLMQDDVLGDGSQFAKIDLRYGWERKELSGVKADLVRAVEKDTYLKFTAALRYIRFYSDWFDYAQQYTFVLRVHYDKIQTNTYYWACLLGKQNVFGVYHNGYRVIRVYWGSGTGWNGDTIISLPEIYHGSFDIFITYSPTSCRLYIPGFLDQTVTMNVTGDNSNYWYIGNYSSNYDNVIRFYYSAWFNRVLTKAEMDVVRRDLLSKDFPVAKYTTVNLLPSTEQKPDIYNTVPNIDIPQNPLQFSGQSLYNPIHKYSLDIPGLTTLEDRVVFDGRTLRALPTCDTATGGSVGDESSLYVAVKFNYMKKSQDFQVLAKSGDDQDGIAIAISTSNIVGVYARSAGSASSIVLTTELKPGTNYLLVATHSDVWLYKPNLELIEHVSGTLTVGDGDGQLSVGGVCGMSPVSATSNPEFLYGSIYWIKFFDTGVVLGALCERKFAIEYNRSGKLLLTEVVAWEPQNQNITLRVNVPEVSTTEDQYLDLHFSRDCEPHPEFIGMAGTGETTGWLDNTKTDLLDTDIINYSRVSDTDISNAPRVDANHIFIIRSDFSKESHPVFDFVKYRGITATNILHKWDKLRIGRSGMYIDGNSSYVAIDDSADLLLYNAWTVSMEFRHVLTAFSRFYNLFSEWSDGGTDTLFRFGINASGHLAFDVYTTSLVSVDTGYSPAYDTPLHLEVSYNGIDTILVFVDGVLQHTETLTDPIATRNYQFIIGAQKTDTTGAIEEMFFGYIGNIEFSDIVRHTASFTVSDKLTIPEFTPLYNFEFPEPDVDLDNIPLRLILDESTGTTNVDFNYLFDDLHDELFGTVLLLQAPKYRLDTFVDESWNAVDLGWHNVIYQDQSTGTFDRGIYFNGTDASIEIDCRLPDVHFATESSTSALGVVDFTVESYVWHDSGDQLFLYATGNPHSSSGSTADNRNGLWLYIGTDDKLHIQAGNFSVDGSAGYYHKVSDLTVPSGGSHVAFVVKDNMPYLFVDGSVCVLSDGDADSGAADLSACNVYNPRQICIGSACVWNGNYDNTMSSAVQYGKGAITNYRIVRQALWTGSFTSPTEYYPGSNLHNLFMIEKATGKPCYLDIAVVDKQYRRVICYFNAPSVTASNREFILCKADSFSGFSGYVADWLSSNVYPPDTRFIHHLSRRYSQSASVKALDSFKNFDAVHLNGGIGVFEAPYGRYANISHYAYFQFDGVVSGDVWGGLSEFSVFFATDKKNSYQPSVNTVAGVILSDGQHWWDNISLSIQINSRYSANISCSVAESNSVYTSLAPDSVDNYNRYAAACTLGSGELYDCFSVAEEISIPTSVTSVKVENNNVRIGASNYTHFGKVIVADVWMFSLARSKEYSEYVTKSIDDRLDIVVSDVSFSSYCMGWEHAYTIQAVIDHTQITADDTNVPVKLQLTSSSGLNSFDFAEVFKQYESICTVLDNVQSSFEFGGAYEGFAGLLYCNQEYHNDRFNSSKDTAPFDGTVDTIRHDTKNLVGKYSLNRYGTHVIWVRLREFYSSKWRRIFTFGYYNNNMTVYHEDVPYVYMKDYNAYNRFFYEGQGYISADQSSVHGNLYPVIISYDRSGRIRLVWDIKTATKSAGWWQKPGDGYLHELQIGGEAKDTGSQWIGDVESYSFFPGLFLDNSALLQRLANYKAFRYKLSPYFKEFTHENGMLPLLKGLSLSSVDVSETGHYLVTTDNRDFLVYDSGAKIVVSNKGSVHGGTDGDWYFLSSLSRWEKAESMRDAFKYHFISNQVSKSEVLNNLTSVELGSLYDSTLGVFNIVQANHKDDLVIPRFNESYIYLSEEYDLADVGTVSSSFVKWSYIEGTTVHVDVCKTGSTDWIACTNGGDIPVLTAGDDVSSTSIQFRVVIEDVSIDENARIGLQVGVD